MKPSISHHPSRSGTVMKIRNLETGLVHERSSPDAREAVETGGYEFADAGVQSIRETLAGLPLDALEAMASAAKIRTHNEQREDILGRLIPLVEQGQIALP